jgi:hypothetical protein
MKTMELYYQQGNITVARSTRGDAEYIAANMRKCDRDEIWASHHYTPAEAMKFTIDKTIFCLTVKIADRPVVMFGVNGETVLGDKGIVWMLATPEIERVKFRFIRHSKMFIDIMLAFYPYLYNFVSVENKVSIIWLRKLGATFDTAKPHGIDQKLFRYFYFKKEPKCSG